MNNSAFCKDGPMVLEWTVDNIKAWYFDHNMDISFSCFLINHIKMHFQFCTDKKNMIHYIKLVALHGLLYGSLLVT